jgi:hypothetical protein
MLLFVLAFVPVGNDSNGRSNHEWTFRVHDVASVWHSDSLFRPFPGGNVCQSLSLARAEQSQSSDGQRLLFPAGEER